MIPKKASKRRIESSDDELERSDPPAEPSRKKVRRDRVSGKEMTNTSFLLCVLTTRLVELTDQVEDVAPSPPSTGPSQPAHARSLTPVQPSPLALSPSPTATLAGDAGLDIVDVNPTGAVRSSRFAPEVFGSPNKYNPWEDINSYLRKY